VFLITPQIADAKAIEEIQLLYKEAETAGIPIVVPAGNDGDSKITKMFEYAITTVDAKQANS
jgi:hypothetical protein